MHTDRRIVVARGWREDEVRVHCVMSVEFQSCRIELDGKWGEFGDIPD